MTHHRPAIIAVALALAILTNAGVASAGTYVINNCPMAGNANAGDWTIFGAPQSDKGSCGGGATDWIGPLGGSMGPNTTDGVEIAVPAGSGITIGQVKAWWSVPNSISGATTFALASTNTGLVGQAGTPWNQTSSPGVFVLPSSSTWFVLADYCSSDDYSYGCTFGGGENADLQLFGSQLTLSDGNPPSGTVTGGGLAGTGTVSGTQSLAYDATDAGSGVRLVQLLVDGQVVATNDYLEQCPYQNFAACPPSISDAIAWNTASVANGTHDVALRILNAAQVSAVVDDHALSIENPPHTPNGYPACETAHISLTVNGRASRAVVRYGKPVTVAGALTCGAQPIIGATVLVLGAGTPSTSLTTNQAGGFSLALPPGPNQTLTFGYRAFADDPDLAASASAKVSVLPSIRLAIRPRHTINGATITWRGHVRGGPYPAGGVTLLVEVREGRRWQPFDEIVARSGAFAYRYTFLRTTEPTTYEFRVALPANGAGGYHYRPTGSNTIRVHVR